MLRPLFLATLVALTAACRPGGDAEASEPLSNELRKREATRVRTARAHIQEMVRLVSTTTTIESERQIEIFPRVGGVIIKLEVEERNRVDADQVLAVLDHREADEQVADAELALTEAQDALEGLKLAKAEATERSLSAELAFVAAKNEYDVNKKAYDDNQSARLISRIDLHKLKLTQDTNERTWKANQIAEGRADLDLANQGNVIKRAENALRRQELALSFTNVTAPFPGVVAKRMVREGDTVSSASPVFVLTDDEHLRCIVPRPQRELPFFHGAMRKDPQDDPSARAAAVRSIEIRAVPEAYPDHQYQGTIEIVSPTVDKESGSFQLTISLAQPAKDDPRPRLMPGMLVRLSIVTEREPNALVVPKRALRREGDRYYIYVVEDSTAKRVEVVEGFSNDELVQITFPGIAAGDELPIVAGTEVVVVGNRDLEDGEKVQAERIAKEEDSGTSTEEASDDGAAPSTTSAPAGGGE
ncbi:MAG: efflux RND transporter periplasmic adaptor subunit [Planctomycetota bacterium]|nr:efflux RND transporter periplasmic adaptor subunit [Planctomycetota bacterium]